MIAPEITYILVHQTRLANTTIAEDDNLESQMLGPNAFQNGDRHNSWRYLQKDLLFGRHDGGWKWMPSTEAKSLLGGYDMGF